MDKAMNNQRAIISSCEEIYSYYIKKGDNDAAEAYRVKAEQQMDVENQGRYERANIYDNDTFIADQLSQGDITKIRKQLEQIKGVKEAWICCKKVKVYPDDPVYVIIYTSGWGKSHGKIEQTVINTIQMPSDYFMINKKGDFKKIAKKALKEARKVV